MPDQTPTPAQGQLWEELDINTLWVHVLRGTPLDEMGINGIAVWLMLKTYTSLQTGWAYPGTATLARRLGCSKDTVERALAHLLKLGVLQKHKVGRHMEYSFIEKLPVLTRDDLPVGETSMRYLPLDFQRMLSELKEFAKTGHPPGAGINVTLNITMVTGEHATVNVQNVTLNGHPTSKEELSERLRALRNEAGLRPRGKTSHS